jgi:hypothetical protein
MICFELQSDANTQNSRGFIGGTPALPEGSSWPSCGICGKELIHFVEIELPDGSAPFIASSRLQVFACREHDDIAGTIYSDYNRFSHASMTRQLPQSYWEISDGHYFIRLLPPGTSIARAQVEIKLTTQNLGFVRKEDSTDGRLLAFKLLGHPSWAQDPEEHVCSCGAPMQLLLQIPEGFGFDMAPDAPPQPNSFSNRQYSLFLGNELYLLACTSQCHPRALWPVLQHS